jgi:hypothetical protein
VQYPRPICRLFVGLFTTPSWFINEYFNFFTNVQIHLIRCYFVGVEVVSHECDHEEVAPQHAMEDVDWVHEGSRWVCKINGCTNTYMIK